jgi:dienelactone hydrolase
VGCTGGYVAPGMKRWALLVSLASLLVAPATASAAIPNVFGAHTISGAPIPCLAQADGVRVCHGTDNGGGGPDLRLKSFDGQPLEVYVILPPAPSSGADGPYPLVVQSHGWGSSAGGPSNTEFFSPTADSWAKQGYAVLQLTARGFGDSCGKTAQKSESPVDYQAVCGNGYIRLDDARYEARDVQTAIGLLVDQGIVSPGHLGVTGESYGGGVSLELATLKDRVMNADGSLSPWTSPAGTPLSITASAPVIPWSDLAYSLLPNGRTLDYQVTSPTADLSPVGVEKQSFVTGLYALGQSTGYYAPPGTNSQADLTTWYGLINSGEPYDSNPETPAIVQQIAQYHSPYYLLDGAYGASREAPAPLLIANGFTDDLFPVDEALRYYNLDRSLYPSDPVSLLDGDFGHERAANKPGDKALLSNAIQSFFDYYLKGAGSQPQPSATATIETCPTSAPSGGPYTASSWSALHPGEVDYSSQTAQTILSNAGDPTLAKTVDPIVAGNDPCGTASATDQGPGVATYRLPAAQGPGYTLLGSPTVIADLRVTGTFAFIAARLWDVDPTTNTETLVARGLYRIDPNNSDGVQVFQLHPGAWHFAAGHIPKLELLGQDPPYARTSNGQFQIQVASLQFRLPVHELPGSVPGVGSPLVPGPQACTTRPYSRLNKHRTGYARRRLLAAGTAGEQPCLFASAAARRRERVTRVYVMIYRPARHGRCRFVRRSGRLTRPRSCQHPIEFRATGTSRWRLRLRVRLAPGSYLVRSDAIDGNRRHQPRTAASVKRLKVARARRLRPHPALDFMG